MTDAERAAIILARDQLTALLQGWLLERLLPALGGTWGSTAFAVKDIYALPNPAIKAMVSHISPRSLGRLLAQNESRDIEGYVVHRIGEGAMATWSIRKVSP